MVSDILASCMARDMLPYVTCPEITEDTTSTKSNIRILAVKVVDKHLLIAEDAEMACEVVVPEFRLRGEGDR